MKKILLISLLFISILVCGCAFKFSLEEEYYNKSDISNLSKDEYNELVNSKKSFAIFIYQPLCVASSDFEEVLKEFAYTYQISFYKMSYANMSETALKEDIKHYPSFVIIKEGKVVDFLDAESAEDTNKYKNIDDFTEWFTSYVKVNDPVENNYESTEETSPLKKKISLDDINYDEKKINIYFFWGNGCSHCEREFAFFEEIEKEYGHMYTLNTFEVWYNEENEQTLRIFASNMNDTLDGVPYTVIGNKTFKGFKTSYKEEMLDAIKTQYKNSYDVYFEKIKN